MRIDAHQHFWRYNQQDFAWIDEGIKILRQDYLPAHVEPALEEHGITGAIAVQARQTLAENDYLVELSAAHPIIKGIVGWVDLQANDIADTLANLDQKIVGVRHLVHDEPNIDFMLGSKFRNGIAKLSHCGLTYDLLVRPAHLDNCIALVDEFPNQLFVVDHIGKPDIASGELEPWHTAIALLASRLNVFCKLSGMVTEADYTGWQEDEIDLTPFSAYMDTILETFTPDRVMFASDWPVCTIAATYDEVYDIVSAQIHSLSTEERVAIMGETATRFYGLESGSDQHG